MEEIQEVVEPDVSTSEHKNPVRFIYDIIETLVLAALLFFSVNAISARIRVDGSSMEPTLHDGEYVIVEKISYRIGKPQRGDVVVFHYPRNPSEEYIKRVIGLPGDTVEARKGQLYVNGQPIRESYIAAKTAYMGSWTVGQDALFVLGDNRNNSSDSHSWGTVPLEYVIGKAYLVYWPPEKWTILHHESYSVSQAASQATP